MLRRVSDLPQAEDLKIYNIGFIGLGRMGLPMADNLYKKMEANAISGCELSSCIYAYDTDTKIVETFTTQRVGTVMASTVAELAAHCSVIITMVPNTQHVVSLLQGPSGIFANARKGTILIDCSTIDPIVSKSLSEEAAILGMRMLDAPVSGGVTGAAAGTLTFMVGGQEEYLNAAMPILKSMGARVVHCGGPGAGGTTKLCNNLALAISMIGTAEAMNLGMKLGMDGKKLAEVMNTSTARCWSSDTYNPVPGIMDGVPSSNNYHGGFGSALMLKDLGLVSHAALTAGAAVPLGTMARKVYHDMCDKGYAQKDFSSVYQYLKSVSKDELL
jgi:3-hydroxyisobutyrate dehydrogenase